METDFRICRRVRARFSSNLEKSRSALTTLRRFGGCPSCWTADAVIFKDDFTSNLRKKRGREKWSNHLGSEKLLFLGTTYENWTPGIFPVLFDPVHPVLCWLCAPLEIV